MREEEYLNELQKILEELESELLEKDTRMIMKKALGRIKILHKKAHDDGVWNTNTGKILEHIRYILAYLIGYVR